MTNKKVISVLAIVAVAAMMGAASIAPAYAGVEYAKNAVRAPFVDIKAGAPDITGTCVAFVDRDGDLHLRMIGHGFAPDQQVRFGISQPGGILGDAFANDTGDVNFSVVIEGYGGSAVFDCRLGLATQEASAAIDISA